MKKNTNKAYMSTVKVGPKGQIIIPKEIRDMFDIEPGDNMMILARSDKGIALMRQNVLTNIADAIFNGKGKDIYPEEPDENLNLFAENIHKTIENGEASIPSEGKDDSDKN